MMYFLAVAMLLWLVHKFIPYGDTIVAVVVAFWLLNFLDLMSKIIF